MFESLKWGTKYESYGYEEHLIAGQVSRSSVSGYLGIRTGDTIEMTHVYGLASGNAVQQFDSVPYRSCKKILFVKKCSTKYNNVPRGFNNAEITAIHTRLQHKAHTEAINRLPTSLTEEILSEEIIGFLGAGLTPRRQVLYQVAGGNVLTSLGMMIGQSVTEYGNQVMGIVNSGSSGALNVNKGGNWRVEIVRSGANFVNLIVSLV